MKIYLVNGNGLEGIVKNKHKQAEQEMRLPNIPPILITFYSIYGSKNPAAGPMSILPYCSDLLIDSGAFSFMQGQKQPDWKHYIDSYIEFINKYDIQKFFELDIDSIAGYDNVLKIRKYIEARTGKQPIPVWHKSRGKEEFTKMCKEYPYVAIGGIVSKEITKKEHPYFTWFIDEAHRCGAKIHGLGYTDMKGLKKYRFDSVDSSSWSGGNRFGFVYQFTGNTIVQHKRPGSGYRIGDSKRLAVHNFDEWVKFQNYAKLYL